MSDTHLRLLRRVAAVRRKADDRLDLALMPVAGVGHHHLQVTRVDGVELTLGGADHRFRWAEVMATPS